MQRALNERGCRWRCVAAGSRRSATANVGSDERGITRTKPKLFGELNEPVIECVVIMPYIAFMDIGVRRPDLLAGYEPEKAEQVAAFFTIKANGKISKLRLVKLIYLADREFAARYDEPMLYDHLVSMPLGPVNSITLNMLNGDLGSAAIGEYVVRPANDRIELVEGDLSIDDLGQLSDADVEVLGQVWQEHQHKSMTALLNYVHALPEWEDPQGSSIPISYERLFSVLGKRHIDELERDMQEKRALIQALG